MILMTIMMMMMTMTMTMMEIETIVLKYGHSITIELLLKPVASMCLLIGSLGDF